jgi:spore maturation protein SpmA
MVVTKVTATGIIRGTKMKASDETQIAMARQARLAGIVLIATMVLWMGAQVVGGQMGWAPRFALLVDLAALAGFLWALVTTYQIWRKRRA